MTAHATVSLAALRRDPPFAAALALLVAGSATIAGAWTFELGLGLVPCPLCLEQRLPYYIGLPIAAALCAGALLGAPKRAVQAGLLALAVLMLWGAGLAVYHAGVEWRWWPGPIDCAAQPRPGTATVGDLLAQMKTVRLVRCDEAPWRLAGLSLAGWNALISTGLAATALWGLFARRAGAQGSSSVSQ